MGEGGAELIDEQVSETSGEHTSRQTEARFAGDPARLVRRDPAAGDDVSGGANAHIDGDISVPESFWRRPLCDQEDRHHSLVSQCVLPTGPL